nr:hypothetical protein [Tanacetum cinerariifolium]
MTHLVTSLTPDSENSCVMQGASCTQRKVSMVLFVLPSVMLLVVSVVTVVIVVVISVVVVVVAIVRVVVVVVGSSVSTIKKISLVIVGSFSCYWISTCLGFPISIVSICHVSSLCFQSSSNAISNQLPDGSLSHNWVQRKEFKTSRDRHGNNGMSDPIGGLDTKSGGGLVNLTDDEDPIDEDGDIGIGDSTGVSVTSGDEISLGGKKSQESNIGRGTIAGRAIITCGGEMVSYACMTFLYGSS